MNGVFGDLPAHRKQELDQAIRRYGALEFGDFTLKSGAKSTFYLDLRRLTLGPALIFVVNVLEELLGDEAGSVLDAVGGPAIGADPIVGGFLACNPFRGFLVRPAPKDHGKGGLVVGSVEPGDRCLVVEDVVTTGGSVLHAIDALEAEVAGAKAIAVACLLDRGGVLGAKLAERGIEYRALLTLEDLGLSAEG